MIWFVSCLLKVKVTQSCLTLCNPMDYTVHGILQARILECVAFPFSRGSSQARDQTQVSWNCRWILYQLNHKGSPRILEWVAYPFSSGSSQPRNQTRVSCIAGRFFTSWTVREALDVVWISTIRNVRLLSLHCRKNEKSSWTEELASEVENLKIFINHTQCFQQHAEFYPAPAQALRLPRVRALTSTPSSRKAVISLNSWHNWWEIILHIYGAVMCGLNLELVFFFSNKLLRSVPKTSDLLSCKNKHVFLEVTPRF